MNYVELTYNLGYVIDDVPSELLSTLWEKAEKAKTDAKSMARELVGQVKEEWNVPFSDDLIPFVDYLSELASFYEDSIGVPPEREGFRKLFPAISFWVNYQSKHQFQPVHCHDGSYSFVVWLEIPYRHENEFALPWVAEALNRSAGCFGFIYPIPFTHHVAQTLIPADNKYEGKIIIFPASLNHIVYPFYTSDEDRVSLAGNLADPNVIENN